MLKALILCFLILFVAVVPSALSSPASSDITNSIVNPSFESLNQAWDSTTQYGTVNIYDGAHARTGSLSAKLSAPINEGPPCSQGCIDLVAAFVGQQFPSSQDYSLINVANSPDSLSVWWYVQPEAKPYSLRIQVLFSDGSNPTYVLGYFHGLGGAAVNKTRSINYDLGPIAAGVWFESRRNIYADLQAFGVADPASFQVTRVGFGALGNYTHGETAWVDDASLMFDRPTALFTANQVSSQQMAFDASSSLPSRGASIAKYTWDFGDDSTSYSTEPKTTHTYSSLGIRKVTLSVEDSRGRLSSTSRSLAIVDLGSSNLLATYGPGFLILAVLPVALFIGSRRRKRRLSRA